MTAQTHPAFTPIKYDWVLGEPYKQDMDANLKALGFLVQPSVESRSSDEPSSPVEGSRYLHNGGTWSVGSVDDFIARVDGSWVVYQPQVGWATYVKDEGKRVQYDGGWTVFGIAGIVILNSGSELVQSANEINLGPGVTAVDDGNGRVTIKSEDNWQNDSTLILSAPTQINARNNLQAQSDGSGGLILDAASGGTTAKDDGTTVLEGATAFDFGANLDVIDNGDGTVTISAASSGVGGPTSSTAQALSRWKSTNGGELENTGVTLDDNDNLAGHGQTYQTKSADFTLSGSEAGTTQECASGAAFTITVPTNSNVSLPIGYTATFVQGDANAITFSPQSGVTLNSKGGKTSTNGQWSAATIVKTGTDIWLVIGDLA